VSLLTHRAERSDRLPTLLQVEMFALGVSQEKIHSSQDQAREILETLKSEVAKIQVVSKEMKDIRGIAKDAMAE